MWGSALGEGESPTAQRLAWLLCRGMAAVQLRGVAGAHWSCPVPPGQPCLCRPSPGVQGKLVAVEAGHLSPSRERQASSGFGLPTHTVCLGSCGWCAVGFAIASSA